jgi:biopolymer transport protein ExbD
MADKPPRPLDVWLVEANTVYRQVPFTVVTDWVQQGRLLGEDRVRPAGSTDWVAIASVAKLAAYLPRPVPQADDTAEALEPVESGLTWRSRPDDDDDEVDMIPLIDVSLVLLIFFMITASTAAANKATFPGLPNAATGDVVDKPTAIWLGVQMEGRGDKRTPVYAIGVNGERPKRADARLVSEALVLERLDLLLRQGEPGIEVTVNATRDVPAGIVRQLSVALERRKPPSQGPTAKVGAVYIGVSEGQP